uniref:Thiamine-monophosphate kinase n=1 Tax=Thermosporothrix sp. COM3 TaxID=2490863 RepID=A0A455SU40_9CHLR|nr:thiamine-monophosphate kinase [Thermosporothrix sp. COM3]
MQIYNEFELIARLTRGLTTRPDVALGVGDDCALLDIGGDSLLLATCDSQVEGVHFTLRTSTPEQIGRKALAVNLSDIAAMGGVPRFALISLVIPPRFSQEALEGIYRGLRQEAERHQVAIVGGNIAGAGQGKQLMLDITLLGTVRRGQAITRGGAQIGDVLCVTGSLGDSAAGLFTLLHPDGTGAENALTFVQARHRTPVPRVAEGRVLSAFGPAVVTAMLDLSDGLSGDLQHLCERSGVGARVFAEHLPLTEEMQAIAARVGKDPLDWALHGGEDYELLFTLRPEKAREVIEAVQAQTGTRVTRIGEIIPSGMCLIAPSGTEQPLQVRSWDHLH